ncbi:MAG: LolA-like putative outer membrane lipoprotein chaperone [Prevotella sp.]|nr:LolA-like putative outer membrane lipoprotein chaperone [Prevotella sp.]MDO4933897.1 LolA-like putative outer membrane lipoprotein chaperone [Prevotella sp.]
MRKTAIIFIMTLICNVIAAQSAKTVLDKTAAVVSNKDGVSAGFKITDGQYGNLSGTIAVKGQKFQASTPQVNVWFDGKTLWTLMKSSNEVNVSNPTANELAAINPYNFINIYRSGYKYDMKTVGKEFQVHLTATDKSRKIQEMYINVNKSSYVPSQVKMLRGGKWSTITISNFKKASLSDSQFRFNPKSYPDAEIIDLR